MNGKQPHNANYRYILLWVSSTHCFYAHCVYLLTNVRKLFKIGGKVIEIAEGEWKNYFIFLRFIFTFVKIKGL